MEPFAFEVAETARLLRRAFDRRAAVLGVTRAQWRVLVRLKGKAGVRQVDLAEMLDVEPITLCRMIDRLEEAGLVERRRDEVDRRAWNIHMTPKALPLIEELGELSAVLHQDVLEGISPADLELVSEVLARVRANLGKADETPARRAS
jgi:DNA-binding MarR family transcriptional regulator